MGLVVGIGIRDQPDVAGIRGRRADIGSTRGYTNDGTELWSADPVLEGSPEALAFGEPLQVEGENV